LKSGGNVKLANLITFLAMPPPDGAGEHFDNSPAIHGWVRRQQNEKVPRGTAERFFRPGAGLWKITGTSPSHEWLGYFQGQRRDAENGHRDGRAPRQSPSWWPCASTGQWQFGVDERGKRRLKFSCEERDGRGVAKRHMEISQLRSGW